VTGSPIAVGAPAEDGVALLTLRRPEKRNALSIAVRDAMSDALDALLRMKAKILRRARIEPGSTLEL
jgi:enoyl-CoA hydratase/carnithine racemase